MADGCILQTFQKYFSQFRLMGNDDEGEILAMS